MPDEAFSAATSLMSNWVRQLVGVVLANDGLVSSDARGYAVNPKSACRLDIARKNDCLVGGKSAGVAADVRSRRPLTTYVQTTANEIWSIDAHREASNSECHDPGSRRVVRIPP